MTTQVTPLTRTLASSP